MRANSAAQAQLADAASPAGWAPAAAAVRRRKQPQQQQALIDAALQQVDAFRRFHHLLLCLSAEDQTRLGLAQDTSSAGILERCVI